MSIETKQTIKIEFTIILSIQFSFVNFLNNRINTFNGLFILYLKRNEDEIIFLCSFVLKKRCYLFKERKKLQRPSFRLLSFNRFKKCFKVSCPKTSSAHSLNNFKK